MSVSNQDNVWMIIVDTRVQRVRHWFLPEREYLIHNAK